MHVMVETSHSQQRAPRLSIYLLFGSDWEHKVIFRYTQLGVLLAEYVLDGMGTTHNARGVYWWM